MGGRNMLVYLQMIETPEDKSKFIILYEEYRDYMYRVALAILHNPEDAEDAVHYAFVKIAENIDRLGALNTLKTKAERREALKRYCQQDTWAMVEILRKVREKI